MTAPGEGGSGVGGLCLSGFVDDVGNDTLEVAVTRAKVEEVKAGGAEISGQLKISSRKPRLIIH